MHFAYSGLCGSHKAGPFLFFLFFYLLKLIPALIFHPSKQRLIQLERRPFRPRSMGLGWADPGAFI